MANEQQVIEREQQVIELANVACLALSALLKGRITVERRALVLRLDAALSVIDHTEHGYRTGLTRSVIVTKAATL